MSMHTPLISDFVPLQARRRLPTMAERTPYATASPMTASFARISFSQMRTALLALVLASTLSACASLPPPTAELSAAQQAVNRADGADADQYAPQDLAAARSALGQAQGAMSRGREDDARRLAAAAAVDGDLATAKSRDAVINAELAQRRAEIAELRRRLQTGDER